MTHLANPHTWKGIHLGLLDFAYQFIRRKLGQKLYRTEMLSAQSVRGICNLKVSILVILRVLSGKGTVVFNLNNKQGRLFCVGTFYILPSLLPYQTHLLLLFRIQQVIKFHL